MVHSIENAHFTFGVTNSPKDRAKELVNYCKRHIKEEKAGAELYRVFYYDCPPLLYEKEYDIKLNIIYMDSDDRSAYPVQAADYVANALYGCFEYKDKIYYNRFRSKIHASITFPYKYFGK